MEIMKNLKQCLLTFFIFGSFHVNSEICNPFKCYTLIAGLFQSSSEDACTNIKKIEKCVMDCSDGYDDDLVKKMFLKLRTQCLEDYFVNDTNYDCFFQEHKGHLLACLYDKFSQKKIISDSAENLCKCKKVNDAQRCFKHIKMQCPEATQREVDFLLMDSLSPWRDEYCHFISYSDLKSCPIQSLHNISDYYKLGKCLDENSKSLTSCIDEKWTFPNAVMNEKLTKEMCISAETFVSCVQEKVLVKCADVISAYHHVEYLFYKHIFPFCLRSKWVPETAAKKVNDTIATTGLLDNYTSVGETPAIVHVHEHVIIEHRFYNSASNLYFGIEVIFLVILLITFKNSM